MHRLFGTKKPAAPAAPVPTLDETASKLGTRVTGLDEKVWPRSCGTFCLCFSSSAPLSQIAALDKELMGYRDQMKRLPPSAQAGVKAKAMAVRDICGFSQDYVSLSPSTVIIYVKPCLSASNSDGFMLSAWNWEPESVAFLFPGV